MLLTSILWRALYPTRENALRAFVEMAYDPMGVTEDTVRDFVNRMRLPNAKYAFMSTLLGIRDSPKLSDRLSKILVPTLFIWGDNDNMIPMQYLGDYRRVSQGEIVVIKDCGHTPYVEKPVEFNKALLNFLVKEN